MSQRYYGMEVNITFIWHDCFVISLPECVIITDFWETAPCKHQSPAENMPDFLNEIPREIPLYVLVSHHHKDHFTRNIFTWQSRFPNIHYIISKDTAKSINYILKKGSTYSGIYQVDPRKIFVIKPGETFEDSHLKVTAFNSTDTGNSYLICSQGKIIFHAGDLNAWIWKDESTEKEIDTSIAQFQSILNAIFSHTEHIDIAFFPVDSRLGTDWWTGASIFVRKFLVRYFFPMHFCLADSVEQLRLRKNAAIAFHLYKNPESGEYIALTEPGESIELAI